MTDARGSRLGYAPAPGDGQDAQGAAPAPGSTAPGSTAPASTAPASTAPASAPPASTPPGGALNGTLALVNSGLFADASNFELRFVEDYDRIATIVSALRTLGLKVVLTSGSFDIIHEGHSMYLEAARRFGDFLIVGLDSDEKISARKGPHRPAVPELERLRMVTHQRGVGLVTLKHLRHERWNLIKVVRPDVLVATADTYAPAQIAELEARYCGRVEVLERMATVSTSARLRRIQLGLPEPDQPERPAQDGR
ncbi:MAG TPA: adenylyltransferase/cytidyltransferase family protein [Streptosporangiaceae bacterium]|jgi:D-beta-D-heptose 7-phosphate kinase/D-beta-D-heptose 1-phosphate adenosyltransferase